MQYSLDFVIYAPYSEICVSPQLASSIQQQQKKTWTIARKERLRGRVRKWRRSVHFQIIEYAHAKYFTIANGIGRRLGLWSLHTSVQSFLKKSTNW